MGGGMGLMLELGLPQVGGWCRKCDAACKACYIKADHCTDCTIYKWDSASTTNGTRTSTGTSTNTYTCVAECPAASYVRSKVRSIAQQPHAKGKDSTPLPGDVSSNATVQKMVQECSPCSVLCGADGCDGPGAGQCRSCLKAEYKGECVGKCPTGTWRSAEGVCLPCHAYCQSPFGCTGPQPDQCYQCAGNIKNGVCVGACAANEYMAKVTANDTKGTCTICDRRCRSSCTGGTNGITDCNGKCSTIAPPFNVIWMCCKGNEVIYQKWCHL